MKRKLQVKVAAGDARRSRFRGDRYALVRAGGVSSVPGTPLFSHRLLGFVTLGVFGALLAWRLLKPGVSGRKATAVYLALAIAGSVLIYFTGFSGGKVHYEEREDSRNQPSSLQADV